MCPHSPSVPWLPNPSELPQFGQQLQSPVALSQLPLAPHSYSACLVKIDLLTVATTLPLVITVAPVPVLDWDGWRVYVPTPPVPVPRADITVPGNIPGENTYCPTDSTPEVTAETVNVAPLQLATQLAAHT